MRMKNRFLRDKRGLELAINMIVIFILAIVVLIALVLFFTGSSTNLFDKVKSFYSYSNVDSVVEGCNVLVDSDSPYSYCCDKRKVNYYNDSEKVEGDFSCSEMVDRFGVKGLSCEGVKC